MKEPNKEKLGEQTCMKQNQLKPLTDCLPKLCDKCGEIFKSHKRMAEHKKSKHSEESVKCPQCPQSSHVYTKHNLNRHIKAVHKEKKFICDTCGKGFALRSPLTVHIKTVHAEFKKTQRNHVCKHCSKAYTVVKALIIHERSAHTGNITLK